MQQIFFVDHSVFRPSLPPLHKTID